MFHSWVCILTGQCACLLCAGSAEPPLLSSCWPHFPPSALPSTLCNKGARRTVVCLYYLISLFQITRTAPFHNILFFRHFTVNPIRLQVSLSTFRLRRYALITLITLSYFPSLHQQHIYNYVFVSFCSQSHSTSVSKFPGHLTVTLLDSDCIYFFSFIYFAKAPSYRIFFIVLTILLLLLVFATPLPMYFYKQYELEKV